MTARRLEGVTLYIDEEAGRRGEPGLWNSYVASLAGALKHMGEPVDPVWLMGAGGFAFRIIVNEVMCPSAMSVFDWTAILPEAVEQAGRSCSYVGRYWHEEEVEEERRLQAHREIYTAVDRGVPAIVWDVHVPEWGLLTGYDLDEEGYDTAGCDGKTGSMPFAELGRREIKILSVTVPGEPNGRGREEVIRRSLEAAVRHAKGKEWTERPKYVDGPGAYGLWASIIEPGGDERTEYRFGRYYAGSWCGARCYARDYLQRLAEEDTRLRDAAALYGRVAELLLPVWERFSREDKPEEAARVLLARRMREAGEVEREGAKLLERWLEETAR